MNAMLTRCIFLFVVDLTPLLSSGDNSASIVKAPFTSSSQQHGEQGITVGLSETFGALPPAIVVSGRRGANSNINGVYIRDYTWHGQIELCYRRGGGNNADGHKTIFLWFEGEWRIGPSPEEETVWAYARSSVPSPLLIDTNWEVWNGRQVVEDPNLWVSDTSVIPSVLFLSIVPNDSGADWGSLVEDLRKVEGMYLQQPGLYDGRPHYRHQTSDFFLLCSVAEERWRLGLPPPADVMLTAPSAATMPHEISESWQLHSKDGNYVMLNKDFVQLVITSSLDGVKAAAAGPLVLGEGAVSLTGPSFLGGSTEGSQLASPEEMSVGDASRRSAQGSLPSFTGGISQVTRSSVTTGVRPKVGAALNNAGNSLGLLTSPAHPKHIVLEGFMVWGGITNGVYRRAPEMLNQRPVYHKADSLNVASVWFTGSEWRLGPMAGGERAWAYVLSNAASPLMLDSPWRHLDRALEEKVRFADATQVIPPMLSIAGDHYEQLPRLCDARPVYRRQVFMAGGTFSKGIGTSVRDLFLFFRSYEGEWCVGPTIGGVECYMTAAGSQLHVVPDPDTLNWYPVASLESSYHNGQHADATPMWTLFSLAFGVLSLMILAAWFVFFRVWRRATPSISKDQYDTPLPVQHPCNFESRTQTSDAPCKLVDDAMSSISTSTRSESSTGSSSKPKRRSAVACVVCFEAPREILLEPCRHVCCCKACADKLTQCPMCRAVKVSFTEVFLFQEKKSKQGS